MAKSIDKILAGEAHNIKESRKLLGSAVSLVIYVDALYDELKAAPLRFPTEESEDKHLRRIVSAILVGFCQQQLIHAALLVLRGYVSIASRDIVKFCILRI